MMKPKTFKICVSGSFWVILFRTNAEKQKIHTVLHPNLARILSVLRYGENPKNIRNRAKIKLKTNAQTKCCGFASFVLRCVCSINVTTYILFSLPANDDETYKKIKAVCCCCTIRTRHVNSRVFIARRR